MSGFGCLFIVDRNGSERFSGTYTIGDDVSWVNGRHTPKAGIEIRDVHSNSTSDFLSRTTFDFNNFQNFGGVPAFATSNTTVNANSILRDMVWALFGSVGLETQAQFFAKNGNRTANDQRTAMVMFRQPFFEA